MLVVLEGLDGAGKSTQVKRLRNYLESLSVILNTYISHAMTPLYTAT